MLLLKDVSRIKARHMKELSIDELSLLRAELESSKAIAEAEKDSASHLFIDAPPLS